MIKKITLFVFIFFTANPLLQGQNVTFYEQINGRYDFTFVGNTLNTGENNVQATLSYLTSSSANLNLGPNDVVHKAYLYWAGSGMGDFNVKLNGEDIAAQRTFQHSRFIGTTLYHFFGAFTDVTNLVQSTGNGDYTFSDLDIASDLAQHFTYRTNFSGWALVVVFGNENLPINQINIYDGMEGIPNEITIILDNLNVIDNIDSKIGFLAWEGDSSWAINETLRINNTIIGNPPLNPFNNAFNSTNSVTGSNQLYNMDLDIYSVQDNIQIGDLTAEIKLTSGQDFVLINTIVTKFNSQLPDATIAVNSVETSCDSREIQVNFTVSNLDCTAVLPANTPISFYIGSTLLRTTFSQNEIPIDGSENGMITLVVPNSFGLNLTLEAIVDDNGTGSGIVIELNEFNNTNTFDVLLSIAPNFNLLNNLLSCNLGLNRGIFDFSSYEELVKTNPLHEVSFHESWDDANQNVNPIFNISNFEAITTPKEIFVRINDGECFAITQFLLETYNCPPTVYNAVSANNDGMNDGFFIDGLRDVFTNFELLIFNRWGKHLWTGNNNKPDWDGYVSEGIGSKQAPEGTYYYILYLNDPDYTEPLTGYLYLTR
jgi:gliding motility-associated-like protein